MAGLLRAGYSDERAADLPLITPAARAGGTALSATALSATALSAVGMAVVRVPKGDAAGFWRGRSALADGRIWLDGVRAPSVDRGVPRVGAPTAWRAWLMDGPDAPEASPLVGEACAPRGCLESTIIAGMAGAARAGAKVVTLGVGGLDTGGDPLGDDLLEIAVNRLSAAHGTLFVVAAGDGGGGAERVSSPANANAVLAVGGTAMAAQVAEAAATVARRRRHWTGARIASALLGSAAPSGFGRVDVGRAVAQTGYTEPASVAMGTQPWPHEDDPVVTKTVTYHNTEDQAVTFRLSLTGSDAPAGMFRLSAGEIAVPAHGTASVDVSADTALPAPDGVFSARVLAEAGARRITTRCG
ncbi:S8 family serine peptidase [Actinokineospora iranica]|uniref:Subtilase family protein n=1 Tax=Actinokineospora iranica TaxID=1271860 RepID=A0A1G6LFR3_9PSEU|nr:S8 family serine peptidase [Actinokineospora iranica]SDC41605.1 Subtilase family protein [Actinokineospora iranica]